MARRPRGIPVYFCSEINEKNIKELLDEISEKLNLRPNVRVVLYLTSPGGDPQAGLHFAYVARFLHLPLVTCAVSEVASAAVYVYLAGRRRLALPDAYFYFHNMKANIESAMELKEWEQRISRFKFFEEKKRKFLADASGISQEKIDQLCNENRLMEPEEALKLGIVHKIIG